SEWLNLTTEFRSSDEFVLTGERNSRLLQLLTKLDTGTYLSGPSARCYLDHEAFRRAGINVEYIDYSNYSEYPQPHPPFVHEVSILDALLSLGSRAKTFIWQ
ncbi:MAG: hypothetical protein JWM11_6824, partial [Planctomycetaceae bacterium]|nr:hypothetical protein [Planctomycetaceae bacterium]